MEKKKIRLKKKSEKSGCTKLVILPLTFSNSWAFVFFVFPNLSHSLSHFYFFFFLFLLILYIRPFPANIPTFKYNYREDPPSPFHLHFFKLCHRRNFICWPTGTIALRGMNCTPYLSIVLIQHSSIHRLELKKDQLYKSYL